MSHRFADDGAYRRAVDSILEALFDGIDLLDLDTADVQLSDGGLSVSFDDGQVFMLSRQTPHHELWLSAIYRAYHFQMKEGSWMERDTDQCLVSLLADLFSEVLGEKIHLEL